MNFFERQAVARKTSSRLILLFALAVLGIVVAVDVVVLIALAGREGVGGGERIAALIFASVVTAAIIGLGSMYRIASLRGGGETIALELGGVPVPEQTQDPQLRRLRNVVEEIAIASGVPVPKLYVLEQESGINAFAAGYAPSDAAIAVTRGALERLNRDELQGVIAHEFSHVLNGDMRLNIRLMGVLFNEELGAVLQVRRSDTHAVMAAFFAVGIRSQLHVIGSPKLISPRGYGFKSRGRVSAESRQTCPDGPKVRMRVGVHLDISRFKSGPRASV